ncbi:MAG: hypothetical protein F6K00_19490 [Leptolyngbya sp. SIOISBB]|nr:hypothetical protein [Leptolyngbya sp. SIOISBB]
MTNINFTPYDIRLAGHLAVGTLVGGIMTLLTMFPFPRAFIPVPAVLYAGANVQVLRRLMETRGLTIADVIVGTMEATIEYGRSLDDIPTNMMPVELESLAPADPVVDVENTKWLTKEVAASNIALIGPGGSGKSANARQILDVIVEHFGLDSLYGILSTHYESEPDSHIEKWLVGIPHSQMSHKVSRSKSDNFKRLLDFHALLERRRDAEQTKEPFKFLVVDDFQYQFNKDDKERAAEIIESIIDEGRKYNTRIVLVLHSIKTKQILFDSGVLNSMTIALFPGLLDDGNSQSILPPKVKKSLDEMEVDLTTEANRLGEHGRKLVAIVCPGSLVSAWDTPMIRQFPNRAKQAITFNLKDKTWLESAKEKVLAAMESEEVTSFSGAMDLLRLSDRHKDDEGKYRNPKTAALWQWWSTEIDL